MPTNTENVYIPSEKDIACRLQIYANIGPHAETFTSDPIRSEYSSNLFASPSLKGQFTRLLHIKVTGGASFRTPITIAPIFDGNVPPESIDHIIQWYRSYPVPNTSEISYHPIPGATKHTFRPTYDDVDSDFRVSYRIQATKEIFTIQIPRHYLSMDPLIEKGVSACVKEGKTKFSVMIVSEIYSGEGSIKICPEYIRISSGLKTLFKTKYESELELMCNRDEPNKMYISQQNSLYYSLAFKDSLQLNVALALARNYLNLKTKATPRNRSTDPPTPRRFGSSRGGNPLSFESLRDKLSHQ